MSVYSFLGKTILAEKSLSALANLMSGSDNGRSSEQSIWKGVVAGLVGGLVGTAAKTAAEQFLPIRPHPANEMAAPTQAAEQLYVTTTGEELPAERKNLAKHAVHWPFGTLVGGAYGALAEALPEASVGGGLGFGTALWSMTHLTTLPLLDLDKPATEIPVKSQISEFGSHLVYGLTTELVRRAVRKSL